MADQYDAESVMAAIQNLSSKRNVITDEALKAKQEIDNQRKATEESRQIEVDKRWDKKLAIIEEFNDSVSLLMSIFQNSRFDELALFASNPPRILLINFMIGILRGIGFAIGFLLMILVALVVIKQAVPMEAVVRLLQSLNFLRA